MHDTPLIVEADGPIATLTLNRPKALNALDIPMAEALESAVLTLQQKPDLRVIVLKGAGTVVAGPGGRSAVSGRGTPALGVAGTGDVVAGASGARLAGGRGPFEAGAAGGLLPGLAWRARAPGGPGLPARSGQD